MPDGIRGARIGRPATVRGLRSVGADSLAGPGLAGPCFGGTQLRLMQLGEAARAQPDKNHIAQNVLLALRNPLAPPAEFQCLDGPTNVLPHLNQLAPFNYLLHRMPLSALIAIHFQHIQNNFRQAMRESPGSHVLIGTYGLSGRPVFAERPGIASWNEPAQLS